MSCQLSHRRPYGYWQGSSQSITLAEEYTSYSNLSQLLASHLCQEKREFMRLLLQSKPTFTGTNDRLWCSGSKSLAPYSRWFQHLVILCFWMTKSNLLGPKARLCIMILLLVFLMMSMLWVASPINRSKQDLPSNFEPTLGPQHIHYWNLSYLII